MGSQITGQVVAVPGLQWTVSSAPSDIGGAPVFWIYIDDEGHWCLRKEGGPTEASFSSRAAAAAFVQDLAGNAPYVLFIETPDGRVVQEQRGATSSARGEPMERDIAKVVPPAARLPRRNRPILAVGSSGHVGSSRQGGSARRVSACFPACSTRCGRRRADAGAPSGTFNHPHPAQCGPDLSPDQDISR